MASAALGHPWPRASGEPPGGAAPSGHRHLIKLPNFSRGALFVGIVPGGRRLPEALRHGRKVWVLGEGAVEDVTVHPATRATVGEYAAWYDRHVDAEWADVVLAPPDGRGRRTPWAFTVPRSSADLRGMGRCYSATTFLTAGNLTHTPGPLTIDITVVGTRLDAPGSFRADTATNATAGTGTAMLVGVTVPSPGCWLLTGTYLDASLSIVVEVKED